MQKNEKQISFKNVDLEYPNGFRALRNINLEIDKGTFVSIIGSSGAGKTTLMKTINKVNPITKGSLHVRGNSLKKLSGRSLKEFRKRIGLIYQGYNLIPNITVMKNVLLSLVPNMKWYRKFFSFFTKREKLHVLSSLEKVGLLDKAYTRASDLSGGQMQRVALARVIAQMPSIILADEPVAALDPIMSKSIMDSFFKLNREEKYTVIANLHHVDLAIKYSDYIIGVKKGKIAYFGPSVNLTNDILVEIYGEELEIDAHQLKKSIFENKELRKKWENKKMII